MRYLTAYPEMSSTSKPFRTDSESLSGETKWAVVKVLGCKFKM